MSTPNEQISSAAMTDENGNPKGDPIRHRIIALCELRGEVSPQDVAKDYFNQHRKAKDPDDGWRRYMNPVKQQMINMARQGLVEITRKGEAVDPNDFRGLVKIRLARPSA